MINAEDCRLRCSGGSEQGTCDCFNASACKHPLPTPEELKKQEIEDMISMDAFLGRNQWNGGNRQN